MEVFGENLEGASAYPTYSSLRNMLLSIVSPSCSSYKVHAHYYSEYIHHMLIITQWIIHVH